MSSRRDRNGLRRRIHTRLRELDCAYAFRTILPGLYEPRPRHIHVKVRLDGQELLTTKFYFAGEIDLQGAEALMLINTRPGTDGSGKAILTGERDIVVDVGVGGG